MRFDVMFESIVPQLSSNVPSLYFTQTRVDQDIDKRKQVGVDHIMLRVTFKHFHDHAKAKRILLANSLSIPNGHDLGMPGFAVVTNDPEKLQSSGNHTIVAQHEGQDNPFEELDGREKRIET